MLGGVGEASAAVLWERGAHMEAASNWLLLISLHELNFFLVGKENG